MTALALAALLPAAGLWWALPPGPVLLVAPLVVGPYAAAYLGAAVLLGLDEVDAWTRRFLS
jgi:hypothetical protein